MSRDTGSDAAQALFVRYDEGQGPPIVLLHGINSDASDWRPVIDKIGRGYRIIALDLLGFGESPKPTDIAYTAEDHSAALKVTLDGLGIDEPILLVGYSLGGDIAIKYAARHPREIRRLFLLSAPFYLPPTAFARRGFGIKYLQVVIFQRLWKLVGNAKKRDTLLYQIANGQAQEFAKQFLRTDDVATHWDIMSKNLRNCIGKATFIEELPKLTMPTTFALGIRDPIVHPDQTEELKRLKPDLEVRRIVGLTADHFLLVALPERVADEIMRDEILSLNVRLRRGTAGPGYVFLHGIEDSPEFWRPVAWGLGETNRVQMIDLLGFGESEKPLAIQYTLADHVQAMARVMAEEWQSSAGKLRLVGHGFGADVAMGLAAVMPDRIEHVYAFSPLLLPAATGGEYIPDPTTAEAMAIRDGIVAMAKDERSGAKNVEKHEELVVPFLRTLNNAVLTTSARGLIERVKAGVTMVLPIDDMRSPRAEIAADIAGRDNFTTVEPAGSRQLPLDDPSAAVLLIDPDATAAAAEARTIKPVKASAGTKLLRDQFSSATGSILWRGIGMTIAGIVLLLWPSLPVRLLTVGFGIWMLVEGFQTIAGAVGLQRTGKSGWLPWLLGGLLLGGVAIYILATFLGSSRNAPIWILALIVALRALYIAFSDIYVAWRVKKTPTAKWLLWLEGLLGLAIGLTIFFSPNHGAALLKLVIGWYLVGSGVLAIAYASSVKNAARKRAEALMRGADAPVPSARPVAD